MDMLAVAECLAPILVVVVLIGFSLGVLVGVLLFIFFDFIISQFKKSGE